MIDRFERFSYAISEISKYWHKIAAYEMEKHGLKGPYAVYFTTLYRFQEGITSAKLGELCSRDKADVSRAISILEQRGLVIKEEVNNNSYRALIKLTDKGIEVAKEVIYAAKRAVDYGGQGLTEEQREIFYNALELIVSNLQKYSKKGLEKNESN